MDLPVEDDAYPSLRLIDPYDDTLFSSYQCAMAEPEFERPAASQWDPPFREVARLIRTCASDPGTCIWFIGD